MISNNMFAYCLNDPINNVDPNGDFSIPLSKLNQFMLLGGGGGNGRLSGGYYDTSAYNTYAIRSATAAYNASLGGYYSGGVSSAITNPGAYVVSGAVSVTDDMATITDNSSTLPTNKLIQTHNPDSKRKVSKMQKEIEANGIKCTIKYVEYQGLNYVVDGHHRLRAAQKLGLKNVPVERVYLPYRGYKTYEDLFNWED